MMAVLKVFFMDHHIKITTSSLPKKGSRRCWLRILSKAKIKVGFFETVCSVRYQMVILMSHNDVNIILHNTYWTLICWDVASDIEFNFQDGMLPFSLHFW